MSTPSTTLYDTKLNPIITETPDSVSIGESISQSGQTSSTETSSNTIMDSFSSSYTDTGMFGVYAGTGDSQIEELIPVLCDEFKKSPNSISEKEINRGKAQLKASLMMSRESAFRRCESAARQLLVFDRVIDPSETIKKIDIC